MARNSFTRLVSLTAGAPDRTCCRLLILRCLSCNLKLTPNTGVHFSAFLVAVEEDSASELTVKQCEIGKQPQVERKLCSVLTFL